MNCLVVLLLTIAGLLPALALKSPSNCKDGQGISLVCAVVKDIEDRNNSISVDTKNISVATNGQSELFDDLKSLIVLTRSLSNQTKQQGANVTNSLLSSTLKRTSTQLQAANATATNLLTTAIASITQFQSGLNASNAKQESRIQAAVEKVNKTLNSDSRRQLLNSTANVHRDELKACEVKFVAELETVQNKTKEAAAGFYNSGIDLLDQVGQCVANNPTTACSFDVQRKANALLGLPGRLALNSLQFSLTGKKSFDSYGCTLVAVAKFNAQLTRIQLNL